MTDMEQRAAAREFTAYWQNRGDEKQETQTFWLTLLQKVLGVEDADKLIAFEVPVKLGHVSFIDAFIAENRVLIEQKGSDIDLRKGYKQSDGSMLTPFQQARRYAGYLPHDQNPRWIVVCNFREFHIHDMNRPNDTPDVILLSELENEYHRRLKDLCAEQGAGYIEISEPLKDAEGYLNMEYSSDEVCHLNNAGMDVWVQAMCDYAQEQYELGEWIPESHLFKVREDE